MSDDSKRIGCGGAVTPPLQESYDGVAAQSMRPRAGGPRPYKRSYDVEVPAITALPLFLGARLGRDVRLLADGGCSKIRPSVPPKH